MPSNQFSIGFRFAEKHFFLATLLTEVLKSVFFFHFKTGLLNMNRFNKAKSAIFISLMCFLLPEDLLSDFILNNSKTQTFECSTLNHVL